jgi:hypothetical protein
VNAAYLNKFMFTVISNIQKQKFHCVTSWTKKFVEDASGCGTGYKVLPATVL